jgi:Protein of unknown function (DUF1153)
MGISSAFAERENNMTEPYRPTKYVVGPDGSPLTIADLPAPGTTRWVIRRKAEVVAAVRGGLLSLEDACSLYLLTVEEFLAWQRSIDRHGLAGLRTTRIQQYRPVVPDRDVPPARPRVGLDRPHRRQLNPD